MDAADGVAKAGELEERATDDGVNCIKTLCRDPRMLLGAGATEINAMAITEADRSVAGDGRSDEPRAEKEAKDEQEDLNDDA